MLTFRKGSLNKLFLTLIVGCLAACSSNEVSNRAKPLPPMVNQIHPAKVWTHHVGKGVKQHYSRLKPAYGDGRIFFADRKGLIYATDAATGKARFWQVQLAQKIEGKLGSRGALVSGGLVYYDKKLLVGTETGHLFVVNAETGAIIWQAKTNGELLSRPFVTPDGLVLIHTANGVLQAFDMTAGNLRWETAFEMPRLPFRGESDPALYESYAIIGCNDGYVRAIELNHGNIAWEVQVTSPRGVSAMEQLGDVDATPVVLGNTVVVSGYKGKLALLHAATGNIIWETEKQSSTKNILVSGNSIYLIDEADRLVAINSRDGVELWRQADLMYRGVTAPLLYKGKLVLGDKEGYLHWIDANKGVFIAQQQLDRSGFYVEPLVTPEVLVIPSRNGALHAIQLDLS